MNLNKSLLLLPLLLAIPATRAHAQLVITPTFDSSITSDPNAAAIEGTINSAISIYEADFTNAVTVNILFTADETVGLGQSSTYINTVSYSDYRAALFATKAKGTDSTAFEAFIPATNPVNGSTQVTATLADLRMLGFANQDAASDSTISLKMSLMNLSRTGAQDPNKYDLFGVASHEIDEVLGFGSALNGLNNGDPTPTGPIGTLDIFRFSAPGVRSFTTDVNENAYLSVDGGVTDLVGFNQTQGGDFHDFKSQAGTPRVQDAFGTPGATTNLGPAELTALTDIGYNRAPVPAVPEASSSVGLGLLLALGLGGLVISRRRKAGTAR